MIEINEILKMSPAKNTELTLINSEEFYTRFSQSAISENIRKHETILDIKVQENNKIGSAQINKFDKKSIEEAYKKAMISLNSQKPDENILPFPEKQNYQKMDLFDEETATFSPKKKAEILRDIFKDQKDYKISGLFTNGSSAITIANSNGLLANHSETDAKVSFTVEYKGVSSSWQSESYKISNIDPQKTYNEAKQSAEMLVEPKSIEAGEYDIILTPYAFFELMEMFIFYGMATLPYVENRSAMTGKLGTKIASDLFTLEENAFEEGAGGMPFDYEGIPREKVSLIENGVLKAFVHDRKTAKKMNTQSTGHSLGEPNTWGPIILNPVVKGGDNSPEEMISSVKKGLYIRKLHYSNLLNEKELLITGMTRDGVFYVEDGEIKHPVTNMRYGESLFKALSNISMLGPQITIRFEEGWGKFPWVKIENFSFTSTTDF